MTEEQFLYEQIARLKVEYEKAIKPYVDRLIKIESLKPLQPFILDVSEVPDSIKEMLVSKKEPTHDA